MLRPIVATFLLWPFHGAGGKPVVSRMSPLRSVMMVTDTVDARSESCPNSIGRNCHRPPGRNELQSGTDKPTMAAELVVLPRK